MATRCTDTHGYIDGRKTANDEAFYAIGPLDALAVVFGATEANPLFQINVRDIPDGALLRVYDKSSSASLALHLKKNKLQGRRGRNQFNYERIFATQGAQAANLYLDGAYRSLNAESIGESAKYAQKVLATVIRSGGPAQLIDLAEKLPFFQNAVKPGHALLELSPAAVQEAMLRNLESIVAEAAFTVGDRESVRSLSSVLAATLAANTLPGRDGFYSAFAVVPAAICQENRTALGKLILQNPDAFNAALPQIMATRVFDREFGAGVHPYFPTLHAQLYEIGFGTNTDKYTASLSLEAKLEYQRQARDTYEYEDDAASEKSQSRAIDDALLAYATGDHFDYARAARIISYIPVTADLATGPVVDTASARRHVLEYLAASENDDARIGATRAIHKETLRAATRPRTHPVDRLGPRYKVIGTYKDANHGTNYVDREVTAGSESEAGDAALPYGMSWSEGPYVRALSQP